MSDVPLGQRIGIADVTVSCGRCAKTLPEFPTPKQVKGWFALEDGWRCGCILKQQPDCDADAGAVK